jgi:hypothetical protein
MFRERERCASEHVPTRTGYPDSSSDVPSELGPFNTIYLEPADRLPSQRFERSLKARTPVQRANDTLIAVWSRLHHMQE